MFSKYLRPARQNAFIIIKDIYQLDMPFVTLFVYLQNPFHFSQDLNVQSNDASGGHNLGLFYVAFTTS